MKSILSNVLIFAAGAAIGSLATWKFLKTKYERIAQEEIDSVKAEFAKQRDNDPQDDSTEESVEESEEDPAPEAVTPTEKTEYVGMMRKLGYTNYSDADPAQKEEAQDVNTRTNPRIISPDIFGELDYKIIDLTYWADGVLTDDKNKLIQDVDGLIGKGSLDQFGKYEEDALHVRDDVKKIDFEILRDLKKYYDFFPRPHQAEDE